MLGPQLKRIPLKVLGPQLKRIPLGDLTFVVYVYAPGADRPQIKTYPTYGMCPFAVALSAEKRDGMCSFAVALSAEKSEWFIGNCARKPRPLWAWDAWRIGLLQV